MSFVLGQSYGVEVVIIESVDELPDIPPASEVRFLDVETKRVWDNDKYGGMYPWKGDRVCGIALTWGDHDKAYYIPIRHAKGKNLPVKPVMEWITRFLDGARWVNHNIVFDAGFLRIDGVPVDGEMFDTLTMAKTLDSDRMGFGLKVLGRDWLDMEMGEEQEVKQYLKDIKSKSYADVPIDLLGRYACVDVIGNRVLYQHILEHAPEGIEGIWQTEISLTSILFEAEWTGLRTDRKELMLERAKGLRILLPLAEQLGDAAGNVFVNSSEWAFDLLINQFNLPVLATKWEKGKDTGRPTFDHDALGLYAMHPDVVADEHKAATIQMLLDFRSEAQHQGLFVEPYRLLSDEAGDIHPSYNQLVRTGRMSCRRPNAQQLNSRAKRLIHPHPGYCFISCDYSQIEFRLIVHYIKDEDAIRAYNEDPDTDFHKWVAEMIGIKRKPAKTVNFSIGYGAGKAKVTSGLAGNPDIMEDIANQIEALIDAGKMDPEDTNKVFKELCQKRAAEVYNMYHEKLPGIKTTSRLAMNTAKRRGYIVNAYGRRRHLPAKAAHRAFNSLVQGCAMDLIKERMVAIAHDPFMVERGIRIAANVHDEILFEAPIEYMHDKEVHDHIINVLQSPSYEFRIPITTGLGVSANNWAEASGDDRIEDEQGNFVAGRVV